MQLTPDIGNSLCSANNTDVIIEAYRMEVYSGLSNHRPAAGLYSEPAVWLQCCLVCLLWSNRRLSHVTLLEVASTAKHGHLLNSHTTDESWVA